MLSRIDAVWTRGDFVIFRNLGIGVGGREKTNTYEVIAKTGSLPLGQISWFGRWRKYAFDPLPETVYEETCLRDIAQFIEEETKNHRAVKKAEKDAI